MGNKNFSPTNTSGIGEPPSTEVIQEEEKLKQNKYETSRKKFKNWRAALFLSLFPLLVVPVFDFISNQQFMNAVRLFVFNSELLFVGVSLSVTAVNDFIDAKGNKVTNNWKNFSIKFIGAGVIIYVMILIYKYMNPNVSLGSFAQYFSLIYFIVAVTLCCIRYIIDIKTKKGDNSK